MPKMKFGPRSNGTLDAVVTDATPGIALMRSIKSRSRRATAAADPNVVELSGS